MPVPPVPDRSKRTGCLYPDALKDVLRHRLGFVGSHAVLDHRRPGLARRLPGAPAPGQSGTCKPGDLAPVMDSGSSPDRMRVAGMPRPVDSAAGSGSAMTASGFAGAVTASAPGARIAAIRPPGFHACMAMPAAPLDSESAALSAAAFLAGSPGSSDTVMEALHAMPFGPLFVTRRGAPMSPNWISYKFSKAAIDAGIQKKVSYHVYKIHSHEVRDLLKSTLLVSGCAQHAADHVLGHAPRDSYEKQATLYPEALRSEYAKASGRLNIFSSIERHLRAAGADSVGLQGNETAGGDSRQMSEAQQQEMQAALQKMTGAVTGILRIMEMNREGDPGATP